MAMLRVLLNGASGRMGRAICGLAHEFPEVELIALPRVASADAFAADLQGDVLVDFSVPAGLHVAIALAAQRGIPLLSGTTGLDAEHDAALDALAQRVAVLQASNFSVGVAALRRAAAELAARLDWDCEIVEAHHRHKRDAPSGTALALAASIREARGQELAWQDRRDESRAGRVRAPGSLGIAALRGGSVVGDHSVHFLGEGERIELLHRADDRAIFARGALQAACRLALRAPGRHSLEAVLWG